ncbi:MAG: phosphoenolpyruvate--protein phosphotransferase, partial [Rhizobiaceae bacterium]|nr:phosphoenolpyruvate--protein phosphotransferase [Rhizobiaceae bacterium]
MPEPHRLTGIPASPGYAEGPLHLIDRPAAAYGGKDDEQAEAAALERAISTAAAQITELMAQADGEAAAILEFQLVMLEDDGLSQPAYDRIAGGANAYDAWAGVL